MSKPNDKILESHGLLWEDQRAMSEPASDNANGHAFSDGAGGRSEGGSSPAANRPKGSVPGRRRLGSWLVLGVSLVLLGWFLWRAAMFRELTVRCVSRIGTPAVPLLRHSLVDDDNDVRRAAAEALVSLGDRAAPPLVESLKSSDAALRSQAILALSFLGPLDGDAVSAILEAADDPDALIRETAVRSACTSTAYGDAALPALLKALKDPVAAVRMQAVEALERYGPRAAQAAATLQHMASDDVDPNIRREAAETLEAITTARPAVPKP